MDQLDLLYRAFLDYRKNTLEDATCQKLRKATMRASADKDKVESRRSKCTIEEDWILAIEAGLPFVEKAIMEERQFIRQEGSVEPIEKVRHVSKDSVEHLARHGNLITRAPEDPEDDLIPDKLYIVEKLTNYAVYENRFLYMLLCYLRDFIDLRYSKILELGNTYKADMTMTKTISIGKRTITYDTHFYEEARNDPYSKMDQQTGSLIDRIEVMQKTVSILLNTPLMREVSTAPMLKPPITRTNALRMDNALKQALALYDYVASYQKPGYKVEVLKKTFNPFPETMADEFSELVVLSSFLVYEYGNNLKGKLKESYEAEEARREAEAAEKLCQKLKELKERIQKEGIGVDEYLLLLEERNHYLESAMEKMAENHEKALAEQRADFEKQKYLLKEEYEIRLAEEKANYEALLDAKTVEYENEITLLKETQEVALAEYKTECDEKIKDMAESFNIRMAEQEDKYNQMSAAYEEQMAENREIVRQTQETCDELTARNHDLKAQLHGIRAQHGLIGDEEDYSSEERYEELLNELLALDRLVGQEWRKAKKKIRHEYLWRKPEQ